jgi:nucleoside-diphosphate-sugar epimerase
LTTKVFLTGSAGRVGSYTTKELLDHGYEVRGVDITRAKDHHTFIADMCDLGQVISLMDGYDAVIHMAAIPSPTAHAAEVVFQTNVISTFNILQAATILGIKKVVLASSLSALGFAFHFQHFSPNTVPFNEDHPLLSQDAYGLSKMIGEELAEGFVRRTPDMSITSLRYTTVFAPEFRDRLEPMRHNPTNNGGFWGHIDVRDTAVANRLSMEYTQPGHEAFYITAPNTYMDTPSRDLISEYLPETGAIAEGFGGQMSLVDCRKAEQVLGFVPKYNWDGNELTDEQRRSPY